MIVLYFLIPNLPSLELKATKSLQSVNASDEGCIHLVEINHNI